MNWKSFKEYVPYLSGLIILLGLIRQMIYYQHYNIEIQNYIGVSELLLAWLDESLIFILLVLPLLVLLRNMLISKFEKPRKMKVLKIFSRVAIMCLIGFVIVFIFDFSFVSEILFSLYFLMAVYPVIAIKFESIPYKPLINFRSFQILFFGGSFIFFLFLLTNQSIRNVDEGNYVGTKIFTKDSTYISNKNNYYIGKTEKFYFIYDKGKKSTLVIPEREVFKFDLKGGIPLYNKNKFMRNDSSILYKLITF